MSTVYVFDNFPISPSENNCYPSMVNKRTGRAFRFPSRELKAFQAAAKAWAEPRASIIAQAKLGLLPSPRAQIRIDLYIAFTPSRLFTKDGRRKQLDASNRIKPIHDALADILGIDDRFFYTGQSEAVLADGGSECVLVKMRLAPVRTMSDVTREMEATMRRSASS